MLGIEEMKLKTKLTSKSKTKAETKKFDEGGDVVLERITEGDIKSKNR